MHKVTFLTALMTASLATGIASAGTDYRKWQLDRIHSPTPQQLAREQAGRVTISDELWDTDVERAMETQFDRIPSMMFVRTIITDQAGKPVDDAKTGGNATEDDDC
ncbi:MAG: hypothetical protein WBP89_00200 [Sedimenticolaceae bacterium]